MDEPPAERYPRPASVNPCAVYPEMFARQPPPRLRQNCGHELGSDLVRQYPVAVLREGGSLL